MAKSKKLPGEDAAALVTATVPPLAAEQAAAIMASEPLVPVRFAVEPPIPQLNITMPPLPVLNRVVRYVVAPGKVRAAIVTGAFHGSHAANLTVFMDGPKDEEHGNLIIWRSSVPHSPAGDEVPGTWHWPPAPPR